MQICDITSFGTGVTWKIKVQTHAKHILSAQISNRNLCDASCNGHVQNLGTQRLIEQSPLLCKGEMLLLGMQKAFVSPSYYNFSCKTQKVSPALSPHTCFPKGNSLSTHGHGSSYSLLAFPYSVLIFKPGQTFVPIFAESLEVARLSNQKAGRSCSAFGSNIYSQGNIVK